MKTVVERAEIQIDLRKPYEKPTIIHELELETRAGSYPFPDVIIDPLGDQE
jgi:hypothetical protein